MHDQHTALPLPEPPPNRRISVALGAQRVQDIFEVVEGLPQSAGWRSRAAYVSYVNLCAPALDLTEPEFAELRRRYALRCDSAGIQILEHDHRVYVWHGPAPQRGTHALKTYISIQRSLEPISTAVVEQLRHGAFPLRKEDDTYLVRRANGTVEEGHDSGEESEADVAAASAVAVAQARLGSRGEKANSGDVSKKPKQAKKQPWSIGGGRSDVPT